MAQKTIILLHGLWMNGLDMWLLKRRLSDRGHQVYLFSYPTLESSPEQNAKALHAFCQQIETEEIHFVCHSLGGLVIRHFFQLFPPLTARHVVTLGTPHLGSHAANNLYHFIGGETLLGKSIERGLLGNVPEWRTGRCRIGVIAGTLSLGLGLIIPGLPYPNDGTVALRETHLPGMSDHLAVRASHFGLLLSASVAKQCEYFILNGVFDHKD